MAGQGEAETGASMEIHTQPSLSGPLPDANPEPNPVPDLALLPERPAIPNLPKPRKVMPELREDYIKAYKTYYMQIGYPWGDTQIAKELGLLELRRSWAETSAGGSGRLTKHAAEPEQNKILRSLPEFCYLAYDVPKFKSEGPIMSAEEMLPEKEFSFDADVEQARKIQTFSYAKPDVTTPKGSSKLCQSDILKAAIQIIRKGGGNNLHSHAVADTCWMVLKGRARFYGEDGVVLGEFGPMEGIMTPRGTPYWFESADDDEDLELLQAAAKLRGEKDVRTNHEERPAQMKTQIQRFSARTDR